MGDAKLLSLKWNNHLANFRCALSNLQQKELYSDATLVCETSFFPVHKFVLSTCSGYFSSIFERTPCKHPFVIIKDISSHHLEFLLSYMYAGEVSVSQDDLPHLLRAAEALQIKGLAVPDDSSVKSRSRHCSESSERESPLPKKRKVLENPSDYDDILDSKDACLSEDDQADLSTTRDDEFLSRESEEVEDKNLVYNNFSVKEEPEAASELEFGSGVAEESHSMSSNSESKWPLDEQLTSSISVENGGNFLQDVTDTIKTSVPSFMQLPGTDTLLRSKAAFDRVVLPFYSRSELSSFIKHQTSPWQCSICGYVAPREFWLKTHMRKHTGEKPYPCPYCSHSSAQKGNLKAHIKRLHQRELCQTNPLFGSF